MTALESSRPVPGRSLRARLNRRWAATTSLLGYLLLTLGMTYPLIRQFATAIPGDAFDGWQNYWNLWWIKTALLEQGASPYFTSLLYHPTGVSLLFHTLNPFNGLLSLPVQLAWGLLPAYNAVVLFSFTMGGLGAYLLARQVLGQRAGYLAPFAAGVIFAFSPFHIAHLLGHMQVISIEWIPFFALYLMRGVQGILRPETANRAYGETTAPVETPARRLPNAIRHPSSFVMPALFLVLVALCDLYYVLYCLLFTMVVLAWAAWRIWRLGSRRSETAAVSAGQSAGDPARPTEIGTATPEATQSLSEALVEAAPTPPAASENAHSAGDRTGSREPTRGATHSPALLGRLILFLALTWGAFGLILSPLLVPMMREAGQSRHMVPDPQHSRILSADLLAFVTPQEFHPLWGAWAREQAQAFTSTVSEHQVFAGFTVLALVLLGLWQGYAGSRRRLADGTRVSPGPWPLVALAFFVLSLGPVLHIAGRTQLLPGGRELPLPYGWLVAIVPFMEISRSVSRMDVMVMLALAVLAALGVAWLAGRGRIARVAPVTVLSLIIFEFLPAPYPMSPPDTPDWYEALAADPRPGAVMNLPMNWDRPGYLLYQTVHRKPLIAAYISRDDPRTLVERVPVLQHFRHLGPDIVQLDLARQGQQVLSDLGVSWVVLDRYKMPGGAEREYTEAATGQIFGAQQPVYEDDRLTVYEVSPPEDRLPYLILGDGWEPFEADSHSRTFTGSAGLVVQSPAAGTARLRISVAPDSPAPDLPQVGEDFVMPLALQPGSNPVTLRSSLPGLRVVVTGLRLEP